MDKFSHWVTRRPISNSLFLCLQALERFYEAVMQAILRHINFDGRAAVVDQQTHTLTHTSTVSLCFMSRTSPFSICCSYVSCEPLICCTVSHFYGTFVVYRCCHIIFASSLFLLFKEVRRWKSLDFHFSSLLVVKCILVASPGFVKDQFITYLYKEAVRQDNKILLENRPKFMLVHSSSGHKYSLKGTSWWALRIKQSNLITR